MSDLLQRNKTCRGVLLKKNKPMMGGEMWNDVKRSLLPSLNLYVCFFWTVWPEVWFFLHHSNLPLITTFIMDDMLYYLSIHSYICNVVQHSWTKKQVCSCYHLCYKQLQLYITMLCFDNSTIIRPKNSAWQVTGKLESIQSAPVGENWMIQSSDTGDVFQTLNVKSLLSIQIILYCFLCTIQHDNIFGSVFGCS